MTVVLLTALAFLCGLPVGFIIGLVLGYFTFVRSVNDSVDPDYSGGV